MLLYLPSEKIFVMVYLIVFFAAMGGSYFFDPGDNVEFVCMKKHAATKTCYYNFRVDGAKYRYVDIGCRFRQTNEVVRKAKEGDIALAREWKVACAEVQLEADKDRKETDKDSR